jgi:hypothetical protein
VTPRHPDGSGGDANYGDLHHSSMDRPRQRAAQLRHLPSTGPTKFSSRPANRPGQRHLRHPARTSTRTWRANPSNAPWRLSRRSNSAIGSPTPTRSAARSSPTYQRRPSRSATTANCSRAPTATPSSTACGEGQRAAMRSDRTVERTTCSLRKAAFLPVTIVSLGESSARTS